MNLNNIMKNKVRFFTILFLSLLLFAEIAYIIRFNFVHATESMDQDAAKLITHTIEIVRTKKLLIPHWRYMTTHEIDSSMLLAIPFYAVTNDIWFSFALSNSLYCFVLLYTLLTIFRNCHTRAESALLVCCLFFIPYSFGMLDYMNMLFVRASQYSIKILIPLLTIALLTLRDRKPLRDAILAAIWLALVFISSFSSGLFPFITGILPILGAYLIDAIYRKDRTSISARKTALLAAGSALSIIGFAVHQHYRISQSGMDAALTQAMDFGNRLFVNIGQFFALINALPNKQWADSCSIVSLTGLGYLMRFALALALIMSAIYACYLFFAPISHQNEWASDGVSLSVIRYAAATILVNVLIHALSTYNAPRYYLMELVCILLLLGIFSSRILDSLDGVSELVTCILIPLFLSGIWVSSVRYVSTCREAQDTYGFCNDICAYAKAQDVDNVIVINSTEVDEICRVFLPERRVSNYSLKDRAFLSYDWYESEITGAQEYYGNSVMIVARNFNDIESAFGSDFAAPYRLVGEAGDFQLFINTNAEAPSIP